MTARSARAPARDVRAGNMRTVALVPCHRHPPRAAFLRQVRRRVDGVLIVDDGMPTGRAYALAGVAAAIGADVLRLPRNAGKGSAIAAGVDRLLACSAPPDAVLVIDADEQHPPGAIAALLNASADAELVIGDRFDVPARVPPLRRVMNRVASRALGLATGQDVRDSQCGMRVLRGRALLSIAFPPGRYEAETRHLKRCLRAGVRVAWVPIPAIYSGQPSSFRPLRDSLRVLTALLEPAPRTRTLPAVASRASGFRTAARTSPSR